MGENIRGPVLSVPMNMLQFEFSVFNFWFSDEDPIITTLSGFQVARTGILTAPAWLPTNMLIKVRIPNRK